MAGGHPRRSRVRPAPRALAPVVLALACGAFVTLFGLGAARRRIGVRDRPSGKPNRESVRAAFFERDREKGRDTPLRAALWDELVESKCPLTWDAEVKRQLANWRDTGVTLAQLDQYCVRRSLRVSVVGGTIRAAHWQFTAAGASRAVCFLWLMQMAILRARARGDPPIPDLELVLQTNDGAQSTVNEPYRWATPGPLFGNVKCGGDASVSVPMNFHDQFGAAGSGAMTLEMYDSSVKRLMSWDQTPWEDKEPRLFFSAGSHSGKRDASRRGHREALFGIKSPLLNIVQEETHLSKSSSFRYLVYAYGRCGWSRRIHELAFFRAVIFMEQSNCTEYFMQKFEPMADHVPVAEDFSDLQKKVERVHGGSDAEARRIADAWTRKARRVFALECVLDYVELLLREYAKLLRFAPADRPSWPRYDLNNPLVYTPRYLGQPTMRRPPEECPVGESFHALHPERSHMTC